MKPTKSISKLFRVISSKHDADLYCFGCLRSYRSNKALKKHKRLCNNNDYCKVTMSDDDNKISKHQFGIKSLKISHEMYVETEPLLIKDDSCSNNPEKTYTETKSTHEVSGYSINIIKSYDKNIHSFYRGKDCIQKFCKDLQDQTTKLTNTPKNALIPLTLDEQAEHQRSKFCHICDGKFNTNKKINTTIITKRL